MTPAIAVLQELKRQHAGDLELGFVCDKGFAPQCRSIIAGSGLDIKLHIIASGKMRRYHNFGVVDYLANPSVLLRNIGDIFKVVGGFFQGLVLLLRWRPDVVFCKGGFVCLPVGYAAKLLRIPLVVHDSDARPGLTNRLLAPLAAKIATGYPLENYNYPAAKTRYTGVPIRAEFRPVDSAHQTELKRSIGIADGRALVVSFGGGLGSESINSAIVAGLDVISRLPLQLIAISGLKHFDGMERAVGDVENVRVIDFVPQGMSDMLAAADIVVTRASATALQELAGLAKPIIAVPARQLGDQIKNAELFAKRQAAIVLSDDDLDRGDLVYEIKRLLEDEPLRQKLVDNIKGLAKHDAARDVASLILGCTRPEEQSS